MTTKKKAKRKKPEPKPKTCSFLYSVYFRHIGHDTEEGPAYCVNITCSTHGDAAWTCLSNDLEFCIRLMKDFPLVHGGLPLPNKYCQFHPDCIVGKIPRLAPSDFEENNLEGQES